MYAALWRSLPGPTWVRSVICVVLALLVVVVLFGWVFPAVGSLLPFTDTTVGAAAGAGG
jgi:hypothetical protein